MKTLLYNPIFINPQAYYVFPRLTRYLQPDNESTSEPANYIGTIEVKVIAYGDTALKRTYTNTEVSMIHLVQTPSASSEKAYTNQIRTGQNYLRNYVTNNGKTGIYGYTYKGNNVSVINNILGDKNDYTVENKSWNNLAKFSVIGYEDNGTINELDQVAWYWTIIANKVLTTDQINQVIAYFNLDRTLNPDILCNTIKQGITNENHAEFGDKLIDFSGNGRDIQLNNIAWDGDSGIGKYNYPNWKVTATIANTYSTIVNYPTVNGTYSINVNGVSELMQSIGLHLEIKYTTSTGIIYNDIKQDGVYSYILPDGATDLTLRFGGIPGIVNEPCNITITQIPSHAGALCLDGVNDFGQFVGDLGLKDYTLIMNRAYNNLINNQVPLISSNIVEDQTPFIVEHWNTGSNAISFSYGASRTTDIPLDINKKIVYQSTYSYMGYVIPKGNAISTGGGITLGKFGNGVQYSAICLWSLMLFPYSMSEFLIERQLKKHKLGTLYPNMVEFRPIIKANNDYEIVYTAIIKPVNWQEISVGDYVTVGESVAIQIKLNNPLEVTNVSSNSLADISFYKEENSDNIYTIYGRVLDGKSPQKITIDIQVDSSLVQWNPVVESTAEYSGIGYLNYSHSLATINVGDYISIGDIVTIRVILDNTVDEIVNCKVNGQECEIVNVSPRVFDCKFTLTSESPQNINITIDEYIRFEDIVQPYPLFFEFTDENGNLISWGGKAKVGSTITRTNSVSNANILAGLYNTSNYKLNGKPLEGNSYVVEKSMIFTCTATYLLDNNEPKCILSPRRLRMPNSSYKILGYIPDISGHGNHGKINNSAYAEGSGVNEDGSYQFDGVDDFVAIPTLSSGGKQVLMKVNWNTINSIIYDQRGSGGFAIYCSDYNNPSDSITVPAYKGRNTDGTTYIDGIRNEYIIASQLRNVTHNIVEILDTSYAAGNINPIIGKSYMNANYGSLALYDFMLFDNISTDDKIKELNEYVGIEAKVELPPYYWDTYGKTNLDADKATIQQRGVAVGDYDLTNTNFAYDKMSGFGGYTLGKFTNSWSLSNSNNSISIVARNPYDITLKKLGENSDWEFNTTELKIISNPVSVKFKSDKNIRFTCDYHYYTVGGNSEGAPLGITSKDLIANEDTIITISPISQENIDKYNIDINRGYYLIYFQLSPTLAVNEEVTIEMLPLYPNGLVYDGITDYSENANIPALTDFTVIAKRVWMNKDNPMNECFIHKGVVSTPISESALMLEYEIGNDTYYRSSSYGGYINIKRSNRPEIITYQTTESYNGISIIKGSGIDTQGLVVGAVTNNYWKGVFYKLILYPKTIPLLQINFLKNLMERDEIIDLNNKIFIQE